MSIGAATPAWNKRATGPFRSRKRVKMVELASGHRFIRPGKWPKLGTSVSGSGMCPVDLSRTRGPNFRPSLAMISGPPRSFAALAAKKHGNSQRNCDAGKLTDRCWPEVETIQDERARGRAEEYVQGKYRWMANKVSRNSGRARLGDRGSAPRRSLLIPVTF